MVFLDYTLEAVSGLRIGAGSAPGAPAGTDLPILRTPDGQPLVPGSSLKGVIRSAAERLLRAIEPRWACDPLRAPCVDRQSRLKPEEVVGRLCWTCQLFGSPHKAARITVYDLAPRGATVFVRDGVGIDRGSLKAAQGVKYDYEVVAPGARFEGRIRLDGDDEEQALADLGVALAVMDLMDAGLVTVGGGASRGLGRVRLAGAPVATRLRAADFRPGAQPEAVDLGSARVAFQRAVSDGGEEVAS